MQCVNSFLQNLKPYHWNQIKETLNVEFPMENKEFNLGTLIGLNVARFQEEIEDISTTASNEANLADEIQKISDIWAKQEFNIKLHKEGSPILCDLEDVQANLDESLTNINTIMGSRYVKRVKPE